MLENNFVGAETIILGGSHIGENFVIVGGSVVHGTIPKNEVRGCPAKYIMSMQDYSQKIKKNTEKLPWIENAKELSKEEVVLVRQKHYFKCMGKDL